MKTANTLRGIMSGLLVLAAGTLTTQAASVTFGTALNEFSIEFVEIGNPGNADDTTGSPDPAGKVEYEYRIGKYEISRDMITKANAEGALGITLNDLTGLGGNGPDRPATGITWFEAATFVNWLNTSSGGSVAYKFDGSGDFQLWDAGDTLDYDASNAYRSVRATYWLPSMDEWYKAAYYDPDTGTYFDYATGSDTAPTAVAAGQTAGTAVYDQAFGTGPADIVNAGGLSPYGTMAQNGNAIEWEETAGNLINNLPGESRGRRGGAWSNDSSFLPSSSRFVNFPTLESTSIGFRVASVVPEPSRTLLGVIGLLGVLLRRGSRSELKNAYGSG